MTTGDETSRGRSGREARKAPESSAGAARAPGARTARSRVLPRVRRVALASGALSALVLLAGYAVTRRGAAEAERAAPPSGRHVEVAGLAQHVVDRGTGPPVLLLHGAFGGAGDWEATVLDELATRYRCVAWDRPGHGYSERPDGVAGPAVQAELLFDLVRTLELERPLLVGFSYGGSVALGAALAAPGSFRGVVLLNAPTHPWPDPTELTYRLPAVPVLGPLATETVYLPIGLLALRSGVERAFAPEPVATHFDLDTARLALRPASFRANAEDFRTLKPFLAANADRWSELRLPVTVVVGTGDRIVDPGFHPPRLRDALPGIRLVRIEGAGHQLPYARPDAVVRAVDRAMSGG